MSPIAEMRRMQRLSGGDVSGRGSMQSIQIKEGTSYILYDADLSIKMESALFDADAWRKRGLWLGSARGRGETAFVTDGQQDYVLRHYRRGGLPGRLVRDSYFWTGLERTRAWREWHLMAWMYERGLPVPRPVAVRVERHGLSYRADLLTLRIPDASSLAQTLVTAPVAAGLWHSIGTSIRRFHEVGVFHADLNAHNILLTEAQVHLIDFDRGCLRKPGRWQTQNLSRLRRSLDKLRKGPQQCFFTDEDWQYLLSGYAKGSQSKLA